MGLYRQYHLSALEHHRGAVLYLPTVRASGWRDRKHELGNCYPCWSRAPVRSLLGLEGST